MKLVPGDGREWSDQEVQRALVEHYAAPGDASFWTGLEQRILTRIRAEPDLSWWSPFPGWVRYGVAVAAAAALVAALASWQTRAAQERIALKELLDTPSEIPLLTESIDARPNSERVRTLRYLLTH